LQALPKRTQEERKFIMRLAPLYEQDREKAIQQGEAIGLQKGRIEGIQQGEVNLVLRLLSRRFGQLPPHITETIQKLSVEKLEDLGEALLDFETQADLINWLN
jgi:predicted transposase YdaD